MEKKKQDLSKKEAEYKIVKGYAIVLTIVFIIAGASFAIINQSSISKEDYNSLNNSFYKLKSNYEIISENYENLKSNHSLLKEIIEIETKEMEYAEKSREIYNNYNLASKAYDIRNYDNVIFYCEKSRDISNSYSQKLRNIKADIGNVSSRILKKKKKMLEKEIDYLFALYESCEYLESASRGYREGDYASGDASIEGQNEAISRHDELVEEYYNLKAEYSNLKQDLVE